ncbi:MAG: 30S ribosomal protein S2 [Rhodobacteraceae bacterium]|nr:30S ribosomal protein S2 [Paracoccaceae bacterium]
MSLPEFTLRQLIEGGVHYGHQSHRWNPLMAPYIHSKKNGIHIIDLTQTVPMLDAALKKVTDIVSKGGSILFVGTKRQAQAPIKDAAERSAQFFINQRWLGGTLTNWKTVSNSIQRLNSIDEQLSLGVEGLTKKELLGMRREQAKLQASLGGIRNMKGVPDLLFVVDVGKEALAVAEAVKLGIPVVAIVDTNCSPHNIDYLIPGNDDASRAIAIYCDLMARAAIAGLQQEISDQGEDLGASEEGMDADAQAAEGEKPEPADDAEAAAEEKPETQSAGESQPDAQPAVEEETTAEAAGEGDVVADQSDVQPAAEAADEQSAGEEEAATAEEPETEGGNEETAKNV